MTSSRRWQPRPYPSAIAMFEATMEALIGWWPASAASSTTCLAMRWRGRAAQRFLLSLPRRHPLLLIEQVRMAQAEGSLVAGHPLQLDDLHHGVGRPAAGDRRQWSPARLAARTGRPFLSQIDNPEAARQRLVWALRGLRSTDIKEGETA